MQARSFRATKGWRPLRPKPWLLGGLACLALLQGCSPAPSAPRTQSLVGPRVVDLRFGLSWARPWHWQRPDPLGLAWAGDGGSLEFVAMAVQRPSLAEQAKQLQEEVLAQNASVVPVAAGGLPALLIAPRHPRRQDAYALVELPSPALAPEGGEPVRYALAAGERGSLLDLLGTLRPERGAKGYLQGALDTMEAQSVRRREVPWGEVRRDLAASAGADAPASAAHPLVAAAVGRLGESHSFFIPPREATAFVEGRQLGGYGHELLPNEDGPEGSRVVIRVHANSPSAAAGLRMGDVVLAEARDPQDGTLTLRLRREGEADRTLSILPGAYAETRWPEGRELPGRIFYVELPGITALAALDEYAQRVRMLLAEGMARQAKGWVLDLRRNAGGYTHAMLPPLAPLLGDGPYGGSAFPDGRALVDVLVQGLPQYGLLEPPPLAPTQPPGPPVAVLCGPLSASAAEEVALAFQGLNRSRRFGLPTAGVPTATMATYAWDGGFLNLAVARMRDRLGRAVDGPLPPDELAKSRYARFATEEEPVVAQALAWLARPSVASP